MIKQISNKRKTRSDKFALTLHPTGQFCKKIKGKLYYFGNNKQKALERYLEQASYLHIGKTFKPNWPEVIMPQFTGVSIMAKYRKYSKDFKLQAAKTRN